MGRAAAAAAARRAATGALRACARGAATGTAAAAGAAPAAAAALGAAGWLRGGALRSAAAASAAAWRPTGTRGFAAGVEEQAADVDDAATQTEEVDETALAASDRFAFATADGLLHILAAREQKGEPAPTKKEVIALAENLGVFGAANRPDAAVSPASTRGTPRVVHEHLRQLQRVGRIVAKPAKAGEVPEGGPADGDRHFRYRTTAKGRRRLDRQLAKLRAAGAGGTALAAAVDAYGDLQ